MLVDEAHRPHQIADLRLPNSILNQRGRDVDAVQHIADVMQDIGSNFSHSRLARRADELALSFMQLARAFFDTLLERGVGTLQRLVDALNHRVAAHQTDRCVQEQRH